MCALLVSSTLSKSTVFSFGHFLFSHPFDSIVLACDRKQIHLFSSVKRVIRDLGLCDWLLISTAEEWVYANVNSLKHVRVFALKHQSALICFHIQQCCIERCHKITRTWTPPVFNKKNDVFANKRERERDVMWNKLLKLIGLQTVAFAAASECSECVRFAATAILNAVIFRMLVFYKNP